MGMLMRERYLPESNYNNTTPKGKRGLAAADERRRHNVKKWQDHTGR